MPRKQQGESHEEAEEFLYAEDEVQAATMVARLLTEGVRDIPCGPPDALDEDEPTPSP